LGGAGHDVVEMSAMSNPWLEYESHRDAQTSGGLIPQYVVDQIRDVLPPSEVIRKYVQLRKAGREWKGLSPFNNEGTPSFFVNDQKKFYYDFSSGLSGDVFAFMMKMEGVTFPEAVRRCAGVAGISIPNGGHATAPMSAEAMAKAAVEWEERRRSELKKEAAREKRMGELARSIARDSCAFRTGDGSPPSLFLDQRF
jgi:DNA primase